MRRSTRGWIVFAAAGAVACGGSSGGSGPPSNLLQVAGSYQVTPSLLQSACGSVSVRPGPAQVIHAPGAAELRLTHAGQSYLGRVERSGGFVTQPQVIDLGGGSSDVVGISGRFFTTGFEATVTVDTAHAGAPPCRYVVGWQASKQGAPNVIPG